VFGACLILSIVGFVLAWRFFDPAIDAAYAALEHRFSCAPLHDRDRIAGIVVLGGIPGRIEAAAELAARFKEVPVIVSGASEGEQAAAIAKAALAGRAVIDRRPENTFENALFSKELAKPRPGERWILVTSAVHMPRAMGAFRAVGFEVEPWPVLESAPADQKAAQVSHEIAGLFVYRVLGRSEAFYPGRDSTAQPYGPDCAERKKGAALG
jgi:uncharacterized SAM-binding protein YcdF (DUF218 family)